MLVSVPNRQWARTCGCSEWERMDGQTVRRTGGQADRPGTRLDGGAYGKAGMAGGQAGDRASGWATGRQRGLAVGHRSGPTGQAKRQACQIVAFSQRFVGAVGTL